MAYLVVNDVTKEVKDNAIFIEEASELGIPFGCQEGSCMTCLVDVIEGMDQLNDRTENEKMLGIKGKQRLTCQCKIKWGVVKLRY